MNTIDIMKDPSFTPILFEIERRILACVHAAKADSIDMSDSQIRSTLNKVRKTSEGGKPKIPDASPSEKALLGLHGDILKVRELSMSIGNGVNREPLPTKVWTLCIRTIEESIQRYSTGPGSQGYQVFLEGFIREGL